MKSILTFLNKRYPFSFQPSRRIKQILPISLCVFLFLVLFKPFGLENNPDYLLFSLYMSSCGTLAGMLTTVLIPLGFPLIFNETKWTLKKNMVWVIIMNLIFVVIMFFAFHLFLFYKYDVKQDFTFAVFLHWLYIQLILGVPLGIIINLFNQYILLKQHSQIAISINKTLENKEHTDIGVLNLETDRYTNVQVEVKEILCVEALGNYINVFYLNNGIKKITLRETIYNIEQRINCPQIIYKPHRSYLVNLKKITKVSGDSQGLKLHFNDLNHEIPVSRNKVKEFRNILSTT